MIKIDPEFQTLIPPLTDDEYQRLEKSILAEGVRECIITWDDTIIDGHNRYRICQEHGLECPSIERTFQSRDAAKIWIIENQFARRNLGSYVRGALALKLEPLYAAEAKRRMSAGGNDSVVGRQKSDNPIRTDEQLAKVAGMSRDTIRKIKIIETEAEKGNETAIEARNAVLTKQDSIHGAYTKVRHKGDKNDLRPLCTMCGKPVDVGDHYPNDRNKHKKCANKLEHENKRKALANQELSKDGKRICTVCGEPIENGDAYAFARTMHKKCRNMRTANSKYAKPDKYLIENVPVYSIDSLLSELEASAKSLQETWAQSIEINESMGVKLPAADKKRLDRAVANLVEKIQSIKRKA